MIPNSYNFAYTNLENSLLDLQKLIAALDVEEVDLAWYNNWQQVREIFQLQIVNLSGEELTPQQRSIHIEIHRSWRLLETDLLFLRSARQAATLRARLKSLSERLNCIITYCQVLLKEESSRIS
jgi:hypothetical protein